MIQKPPHDSEHDALTDVWRRQVQTATPTVIGHYFRIAAEQGATNRLSFLHASHAPHLSRDELTHALIAAAARGQEKTCRLLLGWGADARHDRRALIAAVRGNHGFVTDTLLRHGAHMGDVVIQGQSMSLLALAISGGNADSAKALLLHGANPNIMQTASGTTLRSVARNKGMADTEALMARLWPQPPAVPDDFARRLPLEELRGVFPDHGGFTGFQLAAYHGQADALLARLTANGRQLRKSDLITATPRYPQTVLFILGQRGELAKIFDLTLWQRDVAALRDAMRYVPAAFRPQLDAAGIPARLQQETLRQQRKPHLRLKPR